MTCTTCGRENPPHLTFCQECGQRLGPRIAPPTPPIGLGASDGLPERDFYAANPHRLATSLGGAAAANPVAHAQHAPPPPASPGQGGPAGHGAHAAPGGPERPCRICATPNGPGLRYCTSCGSTLEAVVTVSGSAPRMVEPGPTAPAPAPPYGAPLAPAPAPFPAGAPYGASPAPAPFGGAAQPIPAPSPATGGVAPIAPMRVVDLGGGPRPSAEGPRMCSRCRGVVEPNAQFCKFCGAPLADAASAAHPAGAEPLSAHERLSLPRANGVQVPVRPATVPMSAASALNYPTPMGAMPVAQAAPTPAPPIAQAPAPTPAPPVAQAAPAPAAPTPPPPRGRSTPPPIPAAYGAATGAPAAHASRAATRGRLVVIAKSGADGPSYPFGDALDVGRLEGQIVVGEDPYLSPRHVRIAWTGSKLVLRDLASTNGVYIRLVAARDMTTESAGKAGRGGPANDAQVPGEVAVPLRDQDLILVGQQVLRFELVTDGEVGFGPATEHGTLLFGSPAAPRYARLSQRTVEGVTRDVYYVRKVETVLGRESGDVVFTEDPFLSRRHAAIRVLGRDGVPVAPGSKPAPDGVSFALVDLGSSNGTFIRIRNELELVPGDHFRVGQQLFRVDFDLVPAETRGVRG